jgi:hypothetical protein
MRTYVSTKQKKSQALHGSPKATKQAGIAQLLKNCGNTAQRESLPEDEEMPLQAKPENKTGLPDNLKSGVEALSGYSLDDVRVHYNSPKPAQLHAFAYTQGTDIHVAPGQERHLPHESWHVVQQMQGRVQPTMQLQGINVNDDAGLEHEADVMGGKIQRMKSNNYFKCNLINTQAKEIIQCRPLRVGCANEAKKYCKK